MQPSEFAVRSAQLLGPELLFAGGRVLYSEPRSLAHG